MEEGWEGAREAAAEATLRPIDQLVGDIGEGASGGGGDTGID